MNPLTTRANIAVSKILGSTAKTGGFLSKALEAIKEYAEKDTSMPAEWVYKRNKEKKIKKKEKRLEGIYHTIQKK